MNEERGCQGLDLPDKHTYTPVPLAHCLEIQPDICSSLYAYAMARRGSLMALGEGQKSQ